MDYVAQGRTIGAVTYVAFFTAVALMCGGLHAASARNGAVAVATVLLASFAALRGPEVASDFLNYQNWYETRSDDALVVARPWFLESLYFLINDALSRLGVPFRTYVWLVAAVAILLKLSTVAFFSRTSIGFFGGLLAYASTFFLLHEFTQIRVGLAVALVFLGVRQLCLGKRWQHVLCTAVAAGFHSSAVLFLLLLMPVTGRPGKWVDVGLLGLLLMTIVAYVADVPLGQVLWEGPALVDERLAIYLEWADVGVSAPANPLSASALLAVGIAASAWWVHCGTEARVERVQGSDVVAIAHVRRSILGGVSCLLLLADYREIGLRLFELGVALMPVMAAIAFSYVHLRSLRWLIVLWCATTAFVYIGREEALVRPYEAIVVVTGGLPCSVA